MALVDRSVATGFRRRQLVRAVVRWLTRNLPLMMMALVLASLAWFVALEESDPMLERRYPQPIPITPRGLPEGKVIVNTLDEQVQVTVRAPRSVLDALKVEDFAVYVDLADLGEGEHEVPVHVELGKKLSRVTTFEPQSISLELDSVTERPMPVQVRVEGEPALGYIKQPTIIDPKEVTIRGPTSYVTRVVEAVASVSVQNADADVERELQMRPQDEEGNIVPNVTLVPDMVDVRVPIEPSDYYRSLAVKVVLTGEVASDYRVTDIAVQPPTVTVFGSPDDLKALQGFIETKPINVTGTQESLIVQPALNIPGGVAVVPGQQVEVRILVEAIQSSFTMEITPEIQGLGPSLAATVSPETVEVILSGPVPVLEALQSEDVRAVLELFDLSPGTYQVEPHVVAPEGVTAQSIIPTTVQVEIAIATPTPTGGRPVTATATLTATATITNEQ